MPPSTDWKEVVPAGEAEKFEGFAEQIHQLQLARAAGRPARRALHAKTHGGLEAELTVLPDLPEHARVGLFAAPATYKAYVRYSNGASARQPDKTPDVRGIAIKLLGVPGPKIIPGLEAATTQDFLLIQLAATPFRDADEFVWFALAARSRATLLPRAIVRFGPVHTVRLVRRIVASLAKPVTSVATVRYHSALPLRFGPYAAKLALSPHATPAPGAERGSTRDFLGDEIAARLAAGPVTYDLQVQFFVDEQRTPIEDASREWKAADAPFVTLARLTLPRQDVASPRGRAIADRVEKLSFDPWHATEDFRPLGSMMRARNAAYRVSTKERGAAPEPEGAEIPDA